MGPGQISFAHVRCEVLLDLGKVMWSRLRKCKGSAVKRRKATNPSLVRPSVVVVAR